MSAFHSIQKNIWLGIVVLGLGIAGVFIPHLYDGEVSTVQAANLSSITADSNSYTRLIYANSQYNYYFASSTDDVFSIYLTTSTAGVAGTWSEPVTTLSSIRASVDPIQPFFEIQYNASSSYFGLTAYVSSTDVMIFTTSTDGVTWNSPVEIYTAVIGDESEYTLGMDFLEGTDYIAIGYEFSELALSTDAGASWSTSSLSFFVSDDDDLMEIGISAGPVLHTAYRNGSTDVFYYASSTDNGGNWTTSTIYTASVSDIAFDKFSLDGNGSPRVLIYDQSASMDGTPNYATGTLIFASLESGTWSTSTIGEINYSYSDELTHAGFGFYGAKPYMVYYGINNYANFAYSTSTEDPFTFTTSFIDGANAIGEKGRMSTTYDSANTTAAVAFANTSGVLCFVTSSVDLVNAPVGSAPSAPTWVSLPTIGTDSMTVYWADNSDDEDSFSFETGIDNITFSLINTATVGTTSTIVTGLTPNTGYYGRVAAVNTFGTSTYATSSVITYTNPADPTTLAGSADGTDSIILTWDANSNPGNTVYYLSYSDDTFIATTTAVTYTVTGLTAETEYTFKVGAQYLSDSDTYTDFSDEASATTESASCASLTGAATYNAYPTCGAASCSSGYTLSGSGSGATCTASSGGGGGSVSVPTAPSAPSVVAPTTLQVQVGVGQSQTVVVGNTSHTVSVSSISGNKATITIQSDPVTLTLAVGQEELVDTNSDGTSDIYIKLNKIENNKADLTIVAVEDMEFTINQGLSTINSRQVTLYFNSPSAVQVALSNTPDFSNSSYQTYQTQLPWTLTSGVGEKTVYAKLRTSQGGTRVVTDTITLTSNTSEEIVIGECPVTLEQAYKQPSSNAVYYITKDCTKRVFKRPNIYFTYFDSWNDVGTTTKTKLDSITNDTLGFMPWGPKYDPKYGALVKIVTDPKVYLLLNTEKYWITSANVFTSLNYDWNWIEDIDQRLLDKYTLGSEITDINHHPNYTIVKYENSNKVYRLEPQNNTTIKRWIPNETIFNSLNFRWDRIVTVDDGEVYVDGEDL